ncbi:MAG: VWA domain-containing protein, partial [Ilumatobacteraceae bacterium]
TSDAGTGDTATDGPISDTGPSDTGTPPPDGPSRPDGPAPDEHVDGPSAVPATPPFALGGRRHGRDGAPGRFGVAADRRGRAIRATELGAPGSSGLDGLATATAYATRTRLGGPGTTVNSSPSSLQPVDLRSTERSAPTGELVLFVVDASSSMGVEHRMATTKATVIELLADAYRRRGRVAVITFRGEEAEVVLRPTASIEIARARLAELRTGGATPLAAGLDAAVGVVDGSTGDHVSAITVVVVTDGRATAGGSDPVEESARALDRLVRTGARVVVLDTEHGPTRLGVAERLAADAGVEYRRTETGGGAGEPPLSWAAVVAERSPERE